MLQSLVHIFYVSHCHAIEIHIEDIVHTLRISHADMLLRYFLSYSSSSNVNKIWNRYMESHRSVNLQNRGKMKRIQCRWCESNDTDPPPLTWVMEELMTSPTQTHLRRMHPKWPDRASHRAHWINLHHISRPLWVFIFSASSEHRWLWTKSMEVSWTVGVMKFKWRRTSVGLHKVYTFLKRSWSHSCNRALSTQI